MAPLWCDLGLVPNSRGNEAAANPRPKACNLFRPVHEPTRPSDNHNHHVVIDQIEPRAYMRNCGEGGAGVTGPDPINMNELGIVLCRVES